MGLKHILVCAGKGVNAVGAFAKNNASNILIVVGTVAICGAVAKALIDGPKVKEDIQEAQEEKGEELTRKEKAKTASGRLWPVFVLTGVGIGCYVGAHIIDVNACVSKAAEIEVLRRGYNELSDKYTNVQEAANEVLSDEDKKKLDDRVIEKQIEKHPVSTAYIFDTGTGLNLWCEPESGQYFRSSKEFIYRAMNEYNQMVNNDGFAAFNEFLEKLQLERAGIWAEERGYGSKKALLDIVGFDPREVEPGIFASALRYNQSPYEEYKTWY